MDENLVLGLFLLLPVFALVALRTLARRKSTGWQVTLAANLLVTVFLFSLIPLGGEVYYRFIFDSTDSLVYTKVGDRWMERYWHLNPEQLRDDVRCDPMILPGKRRVTFLGDSFTAGHGIKRIEDRFVNRIRQAHPEWEVHMLAVPGFDTWEETDILAFYLDRGYQLDEVVLVYCLNDVSDLMPGRKENLERINQLQAGRSWLVRNSFFLDMISHRVRALRDPFLNNYYGFVRDGYAGPVWEKQQERLRGLRQQVESKGGRLAVVTFPFLHALGPGYEYQSVHETLDRFWESNQVPHLDLLSVYRNLPPSQIVVSGLDPHPNEHAHALAAEAINQFLSGQMQRAREAGR